MQSKIVFDCKKNSNFNFKSVEYALLGTEIRTLLSSNQKIHTKPPKTVSKINFKNNTQRHLKKEL